ncbi:MAG: prepilin-type N-terminal cleavage/methylation domain-containing protein [Deltaproteobacteria bacterium]|nr:prepilin-type N-terminal cleavage/methylation domain-containing protein [Deltaproteobacteria bacterium]
MIASQRHAERGMTLLEVMIAVALLTIIFVALSQMLRGMTTGRRRIEQRAERIHAARVVLEKMAGDIGMAFLATAPGMRGINAGSAVLETAFRGSDRGEEDELDFTTFAGRRYLADSRESDQRKVGYKIASHPETPDIKQLVRREATVVEGDVREGGTTMALADDIRSLQLEYYDPEKGEWGPDWDSSERAHFGKLPGAVRITIAFPDPNHEDRTLTFGTVARVGLSAPVEF